MSFPLALVLIVGILAFAVMRLVSTENRKDAGKDQLLDQNRALHEEMGDLRERVRVLERIAIDARGPGRLSDEIEALRSEGDTG